MSVICARTTVPTPLTGKLQANSPRFSLGAVLGASVADATCEAGRLSDAAALGLADACPDPEGVTAVQAAMRTMRRAAGASARRDEVTAVGAPVMVAPGVVLRALMKRSRGGACYRASLSIRSRSSRCS